MLSSIHFATVVLPTVRISCFIFCIISRKPLPQICFFSFWTDGFLLVDIYRTFEGKGSMSPTDDHHCFIFIENLKLVGVHKEIVVVSL